MLCQKVITKKTSFVFLIIAGLFLADINITKAVGWTPLTDLSSFGIPAGPISLSDFIIFVYDFLLSAVGIAVMLMIVLGGFRYLTAAGNAASLSEAKDIIYNALYGAVLAICAWIIISTINPDLIYLKKPGADVSNLNYSCIYEGSACNTDAAQDGCNTGSLVDPDCQLAGATPAEGDGCDPTASPADNDCFYETANCCNGTCDAASLGTCPKKPIFCVDPAWPINGDDAMCKCIDQKIIPLVAGQDCSDTCRPNNCLIADIKIGVASISTADNAITTIEQARKTAVLGDHSNFTDPLYVEEDTTFSLVLESALGSVSPYDITVYNWDMAPPFIKNATGAPDLIGSGHDFWVVSGDLNYPPNSGMIGMWAAINANPGKCKKNPILNTWHDEAWVCPISLKITDGAGVGPDSNIDVAYIGFEKP